MSMQPADFRAICPECKTEVAVRKDGNLRTHRKPISKGVHSTRRPGCPGSMKPAGVVL
jgi:hypothetical protein